MFLRMSTSHVFFIIAFTFLMVEAADKHKHKSEPGFFHDTLENHVTSPFSFSNGNNNGKSSSCDGSGKCHEKVSKSTDSVTESPHEAGEAALKTGQAIGDAIGDAFGTVKKMAVEEAGEVKETVGELIDWTKEVARDVGEVIEDIKRVATERAHSAKGTLKKAAETPLDTAETVCEHVVRNASEALETDVDEKEAKKMRNSIIKHDRKSVAGMMSLVNLIGFASAYGGGLWVTFIWSSALKSCLPRKQQEMMERKMYYLYYKTMLISISMTLLGHVLGEKRLFTKKTEVLQTLNLSISLLMVLFNYTYLKPMKDKVMNERMKLEKEGEEKRKISFVEFSKEPEEAELMDGFSEAGSSSNSKGKGKGKRKGKEVKRPGSSMDQMDQRIKKIESLSFYLNLLTLLALTWHLDYLGQRLNMTA